MADTSIQWTDKTWNPVRGCSVVSPGCHNCYAMKQAHRFSGPGGSYEGLTKQTAQGPQWTGVVREVENALLEPLRWRKPARIFVNSMSDLFHEGVSDAYLDRVFTVMARAQRHTFQILTKRADRMLNWFMRASLVGCSDELNDAAKGRWPLPNVWLGVSVEDQQRADERIPLLLQTPAAVRFISAEPLLAGLDIAKHCPGARGLHWVIAGGESGPCARPSEVWWYRNLLGQCRDADVAFFMKQLGSVPLVPACRQTHWDYRFSKLPENKRFTAHGVDHERWRLHLADRKGGDITEFPEHLRVREWPRVEGKEHAK